MSKDSLTRDGSSLVAEKTKGSTSMGGGDNSPTGYLQTSCSLAGFLALVLLTCGLVTCFEFADFLHKSHQLQPDVAPQLWHL